MINAKFNVSNKLNNFSNTLVFFRSNLTFLDKFPTMLKKNFFQSNHLKKNILKDYFTISLFDSIQKKFFFVNLDNIKNQNIQNLGGKIFSEFQDDLNVNCLFYSLEKNDEFFYNSFFLGCCLKNYYFIKYKTKKEKEKNINFNFISQNKKIFLKIFNNISSIIEGVFLTRNLVSEPGNILTPIAFVKEIKKLKKFGLKIKIFNKSKMKEMGMNALLGVAQGSVNDPFFVILEWRPKKIKNKKPLCFVGKGVCFDTGGISLKPAKFMEDMKYDMAGAGAVIGLMKSLALKKIDTYVVAAVALVENMPSGNAQRPGDIVKSYSGKTIEVLNTDAEGRLILADAIQYIDKKYNSEAIVDLATLTGAIIVSLGHEYAGLFSNNDKLSKNLIKSGINENEKLWRFPLHTNYNKLIDSQSADMQNISYLGGAGSIIAAQFLQRFVSDKTPWAHLDIAGVSWTKKDLEIVPKGATGFGVRLLINFVENYFK